MRARLARLAALLGCLGGFAIVFFTFVRPWYRSWGADEALRQARLPGDHLLWQGAPRETRAITIAAPAARVWPWVAQLGQDRGGFYSYELLEDLVGCEMPNLGYLVPALQHWGPGDRLWMYPPRKAGGMGQAPLALHDPGRALVFYTRRPGTPLADPPDGTWAFVVEPSDAASSRLIVRGRARGQIGLLGTAFESSVFEPIHFAMERKMMEGIKARAEGRSVSTAWDDLQVALWTLSFAAFVASALLVLVGRGWRRRLLTFVGAGTLFAFLTLGQPPVLVGAILVAALYATLWGPRRARVAYGASPRR
jgi:hypothetical protein